jgi:hypothetical protein
MHSRGSHLAARSSRVGMGDPARGARLKENEKTENLSTMSLD